MRSVQWKTNSDVSSFQDNGCKEDGKKKIKTIPQQPDFGLLPI